MSTLHLSESESRSESKNRTPTPTLTLTPTPTPHPSRRLDYALRPVALNELEALAAAHEAEGHACILPTKTMVKNGVVVGAVSLGAVCLVLPWFSQACTPRDSLMFIRLMEMHVAASLPAAHPGLVCVPFVPHSRFHPHVHKLGYHSAGLVDLTFKQLR